MKRDKLINFTAGKKVKIVDINAGRGAEMNLMNLGLSIGNEIEICNESHMHAPVRVRCGDTEIAIGYGLAAKIYVEDI